MRFDRQQLTRTPQFFNVQAAVKRFAFPLQTAVKRRPVPGFNHIRQRGKMSMKIKTRFFSRRTGQRL